jgi:hypothetical protein
MLRLRPGLHVVRRDDRHLQVGVDPPWRLVVPDEAPVLRLLADLAAGRPAVPRSAGARTVLQDLEHAGMVVDGAGPRARVAVAVEGDEPVRSQAIALLHAVEGTTGVPAGGAVTVVVTAGEPRRDDVDEHLRAQRPHLLLRATAPGWVIGPFVVPGVTACLRCVDAHLGEHDPRRAVVVEQVAGRPHGPLDPALAAVAVGWAVRDVAGFVAGAQPSTWSATVEVGADLAPRRRTWRRHPHCGCSWAEGLAG